MSTRTRDPYDVLGVARVVSGRFTAPEVILTVIMGAACSAGLVASWRMPRAQGRVMGAVAFVCFGALQVEPMQHLVEP